MPGTDWQPVFAVDALFRDADDGLGETGLRSVGQAAYPSSATFLEGDGSGDAYYARATDGSLTDPSAAGKTPVAGGGLSGGGTLLTLRHAANAGRRGKRTAVRRRPLAARV